MNAPPGASMPRTSPGADVAEREWQSESRLGIGDRLRPPALSHARASCARELAREPLLVLGGAPYLARDPLRDLHGLQPDATRCNPRRRIATRCNRWQPAPGGGGCDARRMRCRRRHVARCVPFGTGPTERSTTTVMQRAVHVAVRNAHAVGSTKELMAVSRFGWTTPPGASA